MTPQQVHGVLQAQQAHQRAMLQRQAVAAQLEAKRAQDRAIAQAAAAKRELEYAAATAAARAAASAARKVAREKAEVEDAAREEQREAAKLAHESRKLEPDYPDLHMEVGGALLKSMPLPRSSKDPTKFSEIEITEGPVRALITPYSPHATPPLPPFPSNAPLCSAPGSAL